MTTHKPADERRAMILTAARTCFLRNGYAQTRMDEIAREAGLSKGGVYFHFQSKDEIFEALHIEHQEQLRQGVDALVASGLPATQQLHLLAQLLVARVGEPVERQRFLLVIAEMGLRKPEVIPRVRDMYCHYVDVGEALIRAGIESGEFREVDARGVSVLLKFLVDGMEYSLALGHPAGPADLVSAFMSLVTGGLLRTPATAP